jgi:hypothetical protein
MSTRFYDIDAANALVPELAPILARLRDQRAELVTLRDAYRARATAMPGSSGSRAGSKRESGAGTDGEGDPELRRISLRMRGIVDQMQAGVAWLDDRSIHLRDIATGLVDFPALVNGRPVWLCWTLGETDVGWWHERDAGFAGRRPLADLA